MDIKKGDSEHQALAKAFQGIMDLPPDHPNSFFNLASYHGFERNACWHYPEHPLFLQWHRKYILLFENALRSIVPGVSLPYWRAEAFQIPDWFFEPPFNSYTIPKEKAAAFEKIFGKGHVLVRYPADKILRELRKPDRDYPNSIDKTIRTRDWPAPEHFERPHDHVHVSCGGWMAQVPRAAFDPIFWMHHCNVERWYYTWQQSVIPGGAFTRKQMDSLAPLGVKIPWEISFTSVDGTDNHQNSFEGNMLETLWYDFVKYEEPHLKSVPTGAALRKTGISEETEVRERYTVGVKVDPHNIDGTFIVRVEFISSDDSSSVSAIEFPVLLGGKDCRNCEHRRNITVHGPVPKNVQFPATVKITITQHSDGAVIPPEVAPRNFNVRMRLHEAAV